MTTKWPMVPLGDVTTVLTDGDWIESKDQSPSGIRLLQTGNVGLGQYRSNENRARYISAETFERLNCTEVVAGDVLISRLPDPIGRACVIPELNERMITAVDCAVLRFIDLVLPEFFVYYSQSSEYLQTVEAKATGTTRQRISRSNLSQILVPLPSLDEQKRIVAKLDAAQQEFDRLNTNLEQQLSQLTDFDSALLSEMLGNSRLSDITKALLGNESENASCSGKKSNWPVVSLSEIARIINGRAYSKEELLDSGRYRVLRVGNFFSSNSWYWSNLELEADKYCEYGDLLYAWSASFGPRIWQEGKTIFHYHIWKIKEDSSLVDRKFLYWWLNWDVAQIKAASGTGSTMMHITKGSMESRKLTLPPLDEQKRIVAKLDEASLTSSLLSSNIIGRKQSVSELQSSILTSAFAGAL